MVLLKNKFRITALAIVLGFILTRVLALKVAGSFWFDEAFSVYFSQNSLSDMWQFLQFEHNPLVHFLSLHFWIKLFGASEIATRSLSLVAGLGSLGMIYALASKLFSKTAGLWAMFFMTISSFFLYHQTEARMYSLLTLFALLTMYSYWNYLTENNETPKQRWLWVYVLASIALVHTHMTALVLPVSLWVHWIASNASKKWKGAKTWLMVNLIVMTSFLLWLVPVMNNKLLAGHISQGWFFFQTEGGYFFNHLANYFLVGESSVLLRPVATFVISLFLINSLVRFDRISFFQKIQSLFNDRYWPFAFHLHWSKENNFLFTIFFLSLLAGFGLQITVTKYLLIPGIVLLLLMAKGATQIQSKQIRFILGLLLTVCALPMTLKLTALKRHHFDEVGTMITEQATKDDLVLAHSFVWELPLRQYTEKNVLGFYPLEDVLSVDERIVRYNWQQLVEHDKVGALEDITAEYQRVFLISSTPNHANQDPVKAWFWQNGWKLESSRTWSGYGDPEVLVFVR
jgi:uncharacterized membrane protein